VRRGDDSEQRQHRSVLHPQSSHADLSRRPQQHQSEDSIPEEPVRRWPGCVRARLPSRPRRRAADRVLAASAAEANSRTVFSHPPDRSSASQDLIPASRLFLALWLVCFPVYRSPSMSYPTDYKGDTSWSAFLPRSALFSIRWRICSPWLESSPFVFNNLVALFRQKNVSKCCHFWRPSCRTPHSPPRAPTAPPDIRVGAARPSSLSHNPSLARFGCLVKGQWFQGFAHLLSVPRQEQLRGPSVGWWRGDVPRPRAAGPGSAIPPCGIAALHGLSRKWKSRKIWKANLALPLSCPAMPLAPGQLSRRVAPPTFSGLAPFSPSGRNNPLP